MTEPPTTRQEQPRRAGAAGRDDASNAIRLGAAEWLVVGALVGAALAIAPGLMARIDRPPPDADRRVPCDPNLGEDYWLFSRYAHRAAAEHKTLVVGDSVVWGHYVAQDGALSAALNRLAGSPRFANLGVDGTHPAAMAGLIEHYGGDIRGRAVVLHCNLLWTSSPRHDLRSRKEMSFNHPALVPQFGPWIACYRATVAQRLAVAVRRELPYEAAAQHVRLAYFGRKDLPAWTILRPRDNPLAAMAKELPSGAAAAAAPEEIGPWTRKDTQPLDPPWVELADSLQWSQFRRAVTLLLDRGNRVFVLVGPFNEHMLTPASRGMYRRRVEEVKGWLEARHLPYYLPEALPGELYADASHPLADGYAALAAGLYQCAAFVRFEGRTPLRAEPGVRP